MTTSASTAAKIRRRSGAEPAAPAALNELLLADARTRRDIDLAEAGSHTEHPESAAQGLATSPPPTTPPPRARSERSTTTCRRNEEGAPTREGASRGQGQLDRTMHAGARGPARREADKPRVSGRRHADLDDAVTADRASGAVEGTHGAIIRRAIEVGADRLRPSP